MFTKIKGNGKTVELAWSEKRINGDMIEHRHTSAQAPRPEFTKALQAFLGYVIDVLQLPESYEVGMRVIGVSISESENTGKGLVVTALKDIDAAQAPAVFNTPFIPETTPNEDGHALPASTLRLLAQLEVEAQSFIDGKRAQQELFEKVGA